MTILRMRIECWIPKAYRHTFKITVRSRKMFQGKTKTDKFQHCLSVSKMCLAKLYVYRWPHSFVLVPATVRGEGGILRKDRRTLYCCWRSKFATKPLLCDTQCFYAVASEMSQQNTQNALLCFHCNNGYTKSPVALLWFREHKTCEHSFFFLRVVDRAFQ